MASPNAMEILAFTEAFVNIPDGMHVWIMTDSAYVKNGITQWVTGWVRNNWKNSSGAKVSNKSLWERLIAAVDRMRRVEWSWVKAHNGRLLNECADMLATKGVYNEPRSCPVETVRVRGEDSDHTVYELLEGEETPVIGKDGDGYPVGRTYVLKAGLEVRPFNESQSSMQGPAGGEEPAIEECLKETLELCTREVQESVPVQSAALPEEEDSIPIPEEPSSPHWTTPEEESLRIYRMMKLRAEAVEWETRPKPVWWSRAWEELAEAREANGNRIPTGSPCEFKECITDEVYALDEVVMETGIDASTGEEIDSSVNPELINVVAVVVWNARGSTMSRRCDRGADHNDLLLTLFEDALKLVPDNRSLTYVTHSD
jgi:ribonuclease HI